MSSVEFSAVVIGSSAGALEALSILLPKLPGNYPLPLMLVVHLPSDKRSILAEILQTKSELQVVEAEDKELIERGRIYIAPPDYHLLVEPDRRLSLSNEEPVLFSRPSIDVLFETAAKAYGRELIGVILTGANSDGANGLRSIVDAGGAAVIQNPDQAQSSIMPVTAERACPEAKILNLDEIAMYLLTVAKL